ncbi:MAG: hypothetical protein H6622_14990 [Halobacteriovoraceae bacterium]|nr:hypothetical protein [Halobacteriovoraceae bacterium]
MKLLLLTFIFFPNFCIFAGNFPVFPSHFEGCSNFFRLNTKDFDNLRLYFILDNSIDMGLAIEEAKKISRELENTLLSRFNAFNISFYTFNSDGLMEVNRNSYTNAVAEGFPNYKKSMNDLKKILYESNKTEGKIVFVLGQFKDLNSKTLLRNFDNAIKLSDAAFFIQIQDSHRKDDTSRFLNLSIALRSKHDHFNYISHSKKYSFAEKIQSNIKIVAVHRILREKLKKIIEYYFF